MNPLICRHLRTKKMYLPPEAHDALREPVEAGEMPHCWCNCTMMEVGEDDAPVSFRACADRNRSCYEAGTVKLT